MMHRLSKMKTLLNLTKVIQTIPMKIFNQVLRMINHIILRLMQLQMVPRKMILFLLQQHREHLQKVKSRPHRNVKNVQNHNCPNIWVRTQHKFQLVRRKKMKNYRVLTRHPQLLMTLTIFLVKT